MGPSGSRDKELSHDLNVFALVTGGGSGIGREICVGLAAAGRHVAVADLNLDGGVRDSFIDFCHWRNGYSCAHGCC